MDSDRKNPNLNSFPLQKAENGIHQAVLALNEIEPTNDEQLELKNMCLADLKEFQDGNLLALRRAVQ